jgi:AcrR family transcriptional regulator
VPTSSRVTRSLRDLHWTPAQRRTMAAALGLIGEHGVSGMSLQMIADTVGVTKAAIWYQFRTKEDIVIAVTACELAELEEALETAELERDRRRARKVLLDRVIEMAVTRRSLSRMVQNDPVVIRLLGEHEPFREFMGRLYGVLLDERDDDETRVAAAVLSAAIGGAVVNPLVTGLDDETLRAVLTQLTKRMLNLTD